MSGKPVSTSEIIRLEKLIKEKIGEQEAKNFASLVIRLERFGINMPSDGKNKERVYYYRS